MPGKGKPFTEGKSPNPGGRPKALAEWRKSEDAQRLRDLSYKTLEDCLSASRAQDQIAAAKELLDRIEGRPIQAITGDDGGAVKVDLGVVDMLRKLAAP